MIEHVSSFQCHINSTSWFQNELRFEKMVHIAWSAPFLKTFENMRKLDFFRLLVPRCASTAAGASSLEKSNFLIFSKVLRKAPDQAKW